MSEASFRGNMTVCQACRARHALGGVDAEALEGALQQADAEIKRLKAWIRGDFEWKLCAHDGPDYIENASHSEWVPNYVGKNIPGRGNNDPGDIIQCAVVERDVEGNTDV